MTTESPQTFETEIEEMEMSEQDSNIDWFRLTWVVMTSLLIFTIGMLGNVTTIYIYTRSKKLRRNKVFELILAALDIYALVFPLGVASYDIYHDVRELSIPYTIVASVSSHTYYVTILCSTICRYVAVFHPFKFNMFFEKWRMRFVAISGASSLIIIVRSSLMMFVFKLERSPIRLVDTALLTITSLISIFVLFGRIIYKLSKMNRVGVAGNNMEMVGRGENVAPPTQTREKHVVAVKTLGKLTVFLLFSFTAPYLVQLDVVGFEFNILYYLNHICNPFVYFLFNRQFRQSLLDIVKRN